MTDIKGDISAAESGTFHFVRPLIFSTVYGVFLRPVQIPIL